MILKGCNSIHTFWMRYSIDLLFIDNEGQVIHIIQEMKPFRFSPLIKKACSVLELKSGTSKKTGIAEGDKLLIR